MRTGDHASAAPLRVSAALGNMGEADWPTTLAAAQIDVLHLDAAETQRSRFRKRTESGLDVAIALDRGVQLHDGDVLHFDRNAGTAVVARVDLGDVLVIDLSSLLDQPVESLLSRCIEVGHAVGSQHWPAVVRASHVYVPLAVTKDAMEAVLEAHRIEGVSWWFARGAEVLPELAPQQARLLFAGSAGQSHHRAEPGTAEAK
ncbi:MAG TPA: hypothetical protein VLM11_01035 [Streptosporangiaceae bacterium]|nr:hypothetical protein [Streptosporangiaceae bacterium]